MKHAFNAKHACFNCKCQAKVACTQLQYPKSLRVARPSISTCSVTPAFEEPLTVGVDLKGIKRHSHAPTYKPLPFTSRAALECLWGVLGHPGGTSGIFGPACVFSCGVGGGRTSKVSKSEGVSLPNKHLGVHPRQRRQRQKWWHQVLPKASLQHALLFRMT